MEVDDPFEYALYSTGDCSMDLDYCGFQNY